jgi:hypothetical protein
MHDALISFHLGNGALKEIITQTMFDALTPRHFDQRIS